MRQIFMGNLSNKSKSEILILCVFQTLTYGSQTWEYNQKNRRKIDSDPKCNGKGHVEH